jgi:hypothetical protein
MKINTLSAQKLHLDVNFLTNVFNGLKYCPNILETIDLRVSNRNFRDFSLFNVEFKRQNSHSARCALAANAIDSY